MDKRITMKRWAALLKPYGFEAHPDAPDGVVCDGGSIRQMIWATFDKTDPKKTQIRLAIEILDRFQEPSGFVTVLTARLGTDRVLLLEEGDGAWWMPHQEEAARAALVQHGLAWLERSSRIETLLAHFEQGLHSGIVAAAPQRAGWAAQLAERLLLRQQGTAGPRVRRPPMFHYYLSLLYNEMGDRGKACDHATQWLEHVQRNVLEAEPERTQRQLAQMDCR